MSVEDRESAARVTEFQCVRVEASGSDISLHYAAKDGDTTVEEFTEIIQIPGSLDDIAAETLQPLIRLLMLAASLSYFKAFAPAVMSVPGGLSPQERRFLVSLITFGLGEFAYVNQLPEVFATQISAPELASVEGVPSSAESSRVLVAVGGGKDSIVSIEALKSAGIEIGLFSVNSYEPIEATAHVAGVRLESARRSLDSRLFDLNKLGVPNGHVPVTAINSIVAIITARALGYDTVAFSNEASSSYGNVEWQGQIINHQWSKGIEFERLLRDSLPPGAPQYVSLLRPLTELRISRGFAEITDYHPVFTSCNRAFKLNKDDRTSWCADCPKCRFVFLCLGPFISRQALLDIFGGRDMFDDDTQLTGFLELLGHDDLLKPFECVGEPDECRVALSLLREHDDWRGHRFFTHPEIANISATPAERQSVFEFRANEHLLTASLEAIVREV